MGVSVSGAQVELAPQTGAALLLRRGQVLRIVDPRGEQVADVALFDAARPHDGFSSGRTIDYNESIRIRCGDTLYSNAGTALARVVEDTVGVHDVLLSPCSEAMFERRGEYHHRSCHANLVGALAPFGVDEGAVTATLNVFMDVRIGAGGRVTIHPPPSRAGDRFALQALTDTIAGITACSSELTNNGSCKPVVYEVLPSWN
ncbi:MAG TPA: urea carboxylase-associated family protein [Candidatus Baltobacteraceae bacterium]|nr:urea carboxylase-associated family protein [Candidatus Baltobacteraceae bacterium]